VLAIPAKRHDQDTVSFLTRNETEALLAAPGTATWHARRDHALLVLACQTGLRVSELTGLAVADARLGTGPHVYCRGKGRKERCTPLTAQTVAVLTAWVAERGGTGTDPLFCTRRGGPLSRDAVEQLLARHVAAAASRCPSLQSKHVSPHTMRHGRHGLAARRRRHHRDRAVDGARITGIYAGLPACRHGDQGTSTRPDDTPGHRTGTIQRARQPA
jgi:site-specific recombinase XerD